MAVITACGFTFAAIYNTRIVPLEKQIESLNKHVNAVDCNPLLPPARRKPAAKMPAK
jgi:hypothetical protein